MERLEQMQFQSTNSTVAEPVAIVRCAAFCMYKVSAAKLRGRPSAPLRDPVERASDSVDQIEAWYSNRSSAARSLSVLRAQLAQATFSVVTCNDWKQIQNMLSIVHASAAMSLAFDISISILT